ncbi:MAG: acyl-protein synthetase [Desulfobacterota bacterium]|nr:acyl-protein synthetase [Thermodesulfobacteriota bacterium]
MSSLPPEVIELDRKIIDFIRRGVDHWDEEGFNRLALEIFELQFRTIPLYRRFCERRGVTPDTIASWKEVPALPTDVFKVAELSTFPSHVVRTFMTSGTTRSDERGKVGYDEGGLRLMDETIKEEAASFLFPDGVRTKMLILAPPPEIAPHMVMAYGMGRLKDTFGLPKSRFLLGPEGFEVGPLIQELRASEEEGIPVTLCGGSFGFVNFFDYCREKGLRFSLPPGSRTLDAGGFKGRSREVTREAFVTDCEELLGIRKEYSVNLLGMTEIASQFYDNTLRNLHRGVLAPAAKVNPPWTRTVVVDPETLDPLGEGEVGLLKHVDLANRGHLLSVQTDDIGKRTGEGFEVFGRAKGDSSRGCSLTIDEWTRILKER